MRKILILGGTSEASALARRVADRPDIAATLSLAGRTTTPGAHPIPVRTGGFGGIEGLRRWLAANTIDSIIDATHPFAAQMSAHAAAACHADGIMLARFTRPPWQAEADDRWTHVSDAETAVAALGASRRRVFLPMGRNSLAPFAAAPWHVYVVRSIDPPDTLAFLPNCKVICAQAPFSVADETALLLRERIDVMVVKNSGGDAVVAKLAAARDLRVPVVMIARPPSPPCHTLHDIEDAVAYACEGR